MSTPSLLTREFFPSVRRPQRYAGGELNVIHKPDAATRIALCLPDLYEIGMSHQGVQMLYHRVNAMLPEVAAERVFLPDDDARDLLRELEQPLFTLESRTPLCDIDLLGFSIPSELLLPGVLEVLDLGGVPLLAKEREQDDPVVIAGGPVMFNPEPLADYLDAVFVGDGDEAVVEIAQTVHEAKLAGLPREETLIRLGRIEGVYLPHGYELTTAPSGEILPGKPLDDKLPEIVVSRTEPVLKPDYYPAKPIVPQMEVVHDRVALEIMRGCTRGCRFCHAGMVYRPVRERPVEEVLAQAMANLEATGYEEIGLLSLSTSDYGPLPVLISELREKTRGKGVSLSFPSLRPDSFTLDMARALPEGRKGGMTFAPEAGTQRLRDVINKNSREEDLLQAAKLAFDEGWNGVKLYFMIGLPTEARADLDGIVELALKTVKLRAQKRQRVTVSVSPFVPKTHTPFQWFGQDDVDTLRDKLAYLRDKFRNTAVKFNAHDPDGSLIEAALSRGDRRLGRVLHRVWRAGGVLESWRDRFDLRRWRDAFEAEGLEPAFYTRERDPDDPLPWDRISKGLPKRFLKKENRLAEQETTTPDCRFGKCTACGLTAYFPESETVCNRFEPVPAPLTRPEKRTPPTGIGLTARIRYSRGDAMRWVGHLDLVRIWDRLLRRAEVPIAFSQGYHPHPKVSFGPPLPTGFVSSDEYLDLELAKPCSATELLHWLHVRSPNGMRIEEIRLYEASPKSPAAVVQRIEYAVPGVFSAEELKRVSHWLDQAEAKITRVRKGKTRRVDIRPFVEAVTPEPDGLRVTVRLINGATVRFDELETAWELSPGALSAAHRLAQWTRDEETWRSLFETAEAKRHATDTAITDL